MKDLCKTPHPNPMLLLQTMQNFKFLEHPITMELLTTATANIEWIPPPLQTPSLIPYPSLYNVSIACHLNRKQYAMFIWRAVHYSSHSIATHPWMWMLSLCMRGLKTMLELGKSHVIYALLTLASNWQLSNGLLPSWLLLTQKFPP
jgi:hypothetical protein